MSSVLLNVNGERHTVNVPPMKRLLDVLREDLHLTGTKEGCGEGECGACAVLLDGELVNSCLVPALQANGSQLCTIEGVSTEGRLHPIQQCFLEKGGAQCGICTPGMILATHHLLDKYPHPSMEQIQEGLAGNLCRCTGYMRIFESVQQAAKGGSLMRSDVTQFELTSPPTMQALLAQLASEPGRHTPIAGGTELMVALNTGRLQQRSLLSIQHLRELRFIRLTDDAIDIGSGTTFTDIRRHAGVTEHLPLLVQSASWTGSVANQNRATLGGNICNASPAADTPPVLLVHDATLVLVSASGTREVPYVDFHLGYKKTVLRPDELVHSVHVPVLHSYKLYIRKVGTRNAQAISKVALAAAARMDGDVIADIRIGAASLADRPVRCSAAEASLVGKRISEDAIREARAALAAEAKPIDDIRSTAKYRAAVAANLLEEFLRTLTE